MKKAGANNGDRSNRLTRFTSTACIVIILSIAFGLSFGQSATNKALEFFKEEISMIVNEGEFTISGTYYFRNNTNGDRPMPVIFPFHIDDFTHYPREIRVFITKGSEPVTVINFEENKDRGSIRMQIPMKAHETTVWHIQYTQKIDKPMATYILKSTQAWGQPLEEALYRIDIPDNIDIDYIWADVDSVTEQDHREILWIHKTEYMPFKDMVIRWNNN